eukprot:1785175-Rhodomonas_salina.1
MRRGPRGGGLQAGGGAPRASGGEDKAGGVLEKHLLCCPESSRGAAATGTVRSRAEAVAHQSTLPHQATTTGKYLYFPSVHTRPPHALPPLVVHITR